MGSDWLLQTIYAALIGQSMMPTDLPPTQPSTNNNNNNNSARLSNPVVHTPYGDVRGFQEVSSSGVTVSTFLGIPYASPPLGNLRFNKPSPASKWSGVRDATEFQNECFQRIVPQGYIQLTDKKLARVEDCLYLNIYKPEPKTGSSPSDSLPVMVWIHGGGFILGAGSHYKGTELAANGAIMVTINYRLDVFGFLSNEDDVIPGNYGMLDQVMALKWVRESIGSFGGDPDKVTIFGESAGSASVSYLVLSPLAKGLFSGAIMESGTSLSQWGFQFPASRVTPSQMTNLIGAGVGCVDKDAVKKLECLRKVDAQTLFNASLAVEDALGLSIMLKPVVETKFGFLPDRPVTLWSQGKFNHVNTIRGFCRAENAPETLLMSNFSISIQEFATGIKEHLKEYAIIDIDQMINTIMQELNIDSKTNEHEIFIKLTGVFTDIDFRGPTLLEQNLESKMAPEKKHYVYEFDYKPSRSTTPAWMPPQHGDDLQFVFGVDTPLPFTQTELAPSRNDDLVSKLVQIMWTNFASDGMPVTPRIAAAGSDTLPSSMPLSWALYGGEGVANVLRIGLTSQEVSFKSHPALKTFQSVLKRLDSFLPERFIVG